MFDLELIAMMDAVTDGAALVPVLDEECWDNEDEYVEEELS